MTAVWKCRKIAKRSIAFPLTRDIKKIFKKNLYFVLAKKNRFHYYNNCVSTQGDRVLK